MLPDMFLHEWEAFIGWRPRHWGNLDIKRGNARRDFFA